MRYLLVLLLLTTKSLFAQTFHLTKAYTNYKSNVTNDMKALTSSDKMKITPDSRFVFNKKEMIHYKSKAEVELMRESNLLVGKTLALIASLLKPGITTLELDTKAEEFIKDNNSLPSFKGYGDPAFPYTCCISVNDAVVHGFPTKKELRDGDIVSVDVGVYKNGFHGDSAYTFAIGEIEDAVKKSGYKDAAEVIKYIMEKK